MQTLMRQPLDLGHEFEHLPRELVDQRPGERRIILAGQLFDAFGDESHGLGAQAGRLALDPVCQLRDARGVVARGSRAQLVHPMKRISATASIAVSLAIALVAAGIIYGYDLHPLGLAPGQ